MSGLSFICDYSSESEVSDSEFPTRPKLPAPNLSKVPVVELEEHIDNPLLHGGNTRTFPHVRGNWATYIYIKNPIERSLCKLNAKFEEYFNSNNLKWNKCNDIHISLSKTFTIQYHMIVPLTNSLQNIFIDKDSFDLEFSGLKVYCNEQKSRTFIAFEVDHYSQRYLLSLTEDIDNILKEYRLPIFYKEPSYHMSIFWANGDKEVDATNILKDLNVLLSSELEKVLKATVVDKVLCKTGNKYFQFYFK